MAGSVIISVARARGLNLSPLPGLGPLCGQSQVRTFVDRLTDTPMAGSPRAAPRADGQRHRPGGTTGLLGAPHTHAQRHTTTARLLGTREVASAAARPGGSGVQSPPQRPRLSWGLPPGRRREGSGRPRPEGGRAGDEGPGRGGGGWRPSLQGLQHQQLFQHLRLAGLSDLAGQEHLVHDRVNLSEGTAGGDPGVREGHPPHRPPCNGAGLNVGSRGL